MKWCTDFLVHRTLVFGVWPVGAMILFLKVALHDTWLCHPHAPSVMLHTVTCSTVSQSVPPSQISVNSGVVDVLCIRIQSHSGCGIHGCSTPLPVSTPFELSSPMSPSLGKPVSALFLSGLQLFPTRGSAAWSCVAAFSSLPTRGSAACQSYVAAFSSSPAMGSTACQSYVAAFSSSPQGAPQHLAVGFVSSPSVLPARAPQPLAVVSLVLV